MDRPQDTHTKKSLVEQIRDQKISLSVALVALVFAMTGGAIAGGVTASKITTKQIKNGTIRAVDLARGAVRARSIAKGQVKAAAIGRGEVRAASIGADQVTADAIGTDQVTADAIADNQVGAKQIAPDSVGSAEVAPNAIGSGAIANGAVQAADIGSGQVGSGAIANGSVSGDDIGDGEITPDNLELPAPVTLSIPAGQAAATQATDTYAKVAEVGTYAKVDGRSALQLTWTGSASTRNGGHTPGCLFQLRVDGQSSAGAASGEVYVDTNTTASVSSTVLFEGLPVGTHTIEIWTRVPRWDGRDMNCTVGHPDAPVAQAVVVAEQVV